MYDQIKVYNCLISRWPSMKDDLKIFFRTIFYFLRKVQRKYQRKSRVWLCSAQLVCHISCPVLSLGWAVYRLSLVVSIAPDISQILSFFFNKKVCVVLVGLAIFALDVLVAGLCSSISRRSKGVFMLAVSPLSCKNFFWSSSKAVTIARIDMCM